MSELLILLRRWAELEPERCRVEDGVAKIAINGFEFWSLHPQPNAVDYGHLQRCLQQAIVARGWDFNLLSALNLKNEVVYFAAICHANGTVFNGTEQSEPAIALLEAYIQALEAFQKNGGGSPWHP